MADPLNLVTSAFRSSTDLLQTVRSFQSQHKDARMLKDEIVALNSVMETLLETIASNPGIDFQGLKFPLERCGKVCDEYNRLISRCSKNSEGKSGPSARDWVKQQYHQGDIVAFKDMLANYKGTINVALANANIRVAAITPQLLEEYKETLSDTSSDLKAYLDIIVEKVNLLSAKGDSEADNDAEWRAMLEEKETTQQGLRMCTQLSAQIELYESLAKEPPQFQDRPSAHKHLKTGFHGARGSLESVVARLQAHEANLDKQMEGMRSKEGAATELSRLEETRDSIRQCINIVSSASDDLVNEPVNVFEDISLADNSYEFSVSTVGQLITARRLTLRGRSRHVAGQITEKNYSDTIAAITSLDREYLKYAPRAGQESDQDSPSSDNTGERAEASMADFSRYGRGLKLPPPREG
ncbi:hypothetical protein V2G26_010884 [Clonostachys chloroleuca]